MTISQTHFSKAIRFLQQDNWDKALESLQMAADLKEQLDPIDHVYLLVAHGLAYAASGDTVAARKALTAAKRLPSSPYLPDKFISQSISNLDIEADCSIPVPGIMAKGRPVTMELHFQKNVIITAALRQVPLSDDMIDKSVKDMGDAILRSVSDRTGEDKPPRRWWQFW